MSQARVNIGRALSLCFGLMKIIVRWLLLAAERERVEARAARITHLFTSNRLLEIRYQF